MNRKPPSFRLSPKPNDHCAMLLNTTRDFSRSLNKPKPREFQSRTLPTRCETTPTTWMPIPRSLNDFRRAYPNSNASTESTAQNY